MEGINLSKQCKFTSDSKQMERDVKIDILRGFAATIVVFFHVLQHFEGESNSVVYNIIFSIQMPLFMMISGYTRVYSKPINSFSVYWNHMQKRTRSLLLPWLSWSILAYVFLSHLTFFEHVKMAAFKMEVAFWFLFSLYTLNFLFSTSEYFVYSISRKCKFNIVPLLGILLFFVMGILSLLLLGLKVGITFLAIKYTVYYSIFYVLGVFIGKVRNGILWEELKTVRDFTFFFLLVFYSIMISKYNLPQMPDHSISIVIRLIISLSICYVCFEVIDRVKINGTVIMNLLKKAGNVSLEMYVVHLLVVKMFIGGGIDITTATGFSVAIVYFIIVLLITATIIGIVNLGKFSKLILFGK